MPIIKRSFLLVSNTLLTLIIYIGITIVVNKMIKDGICQGNISIDIEIGPHFKWWALKCGLLQQDMTGRDIRQMPLKNAHTSRNYVFNKGQHYGLSGRWFSRERRRIACLQFFFHVGDNQKQNTSNVLNLCFIQQAIQCLLQATFDIHSSALITKLIDPGE